MKYFTLQYKLLNLLLACASFICLKVQAQQYMQPLSFSQGFEHQDALIIETPDASEWDAKLNKNYNAIQKMDPDIAKDYPLLVARIYKTGISLV